MAATDACMAAVHSAGATSRPAVRPAKKIWVVSAVTLYCEKRDSGWWPAMPVYRSASPTFAGSRVSRASEGMSFGQADATSQDASTVPKKPAGTTPAAESESWSAEAPL